MAPQDNALYGRLNRRIHIDDIQALLRNHEILVHANRRHHLTAFADDAFRADIYVAGPIGYRLSQPLSGRHEQSFCPCRHPRIVYETGMAAMSVAYGLTSRNACASPLHGQGNRPFPCRCLCPQSDIEVRTIWQKPMID